MDMYDELGKWKDLAEKRRINEAFMGKWLSLEFKNISLASFFIKRGIREIVLYGFGVLGKLVVESIQGSDVSIVCIVDKKAEADFGHILHDRSVKKWQDAYILVSVLSDQQNILDELKTLGCSHYFSLEYVLDSLIAEGEGKKAEVSKYPEIRKFNKMESVNGLEVANFGTGMGYYDFNYEGLGINAFNFSLPQQSLEFDYKLMKHYQDKFLPGCCMFLVLPYCIFLACHVFEIYEVNERYYSILPSEEVKTACNISDAAYLRVRKKDEELQVDGREELFLDAPAAEIRKEQIQGLLDCWKRQLGIISFQTGEMKPYHPFELETAGGWLRRIFALCKENKWNPVVIVPPMSQELLERIGNEFRQTFFYNILAKYVPKNVPVLDYTQEESFCDLSFFAWPCFLTREKARIFTQDVLTKTGVIQ